MKSKKNFKKKQNHYRKEEEPIRIREKRKRPKRLSKHSIYDLLEDDTLNRRLPTS